MTADALEPAGAIVVIGGGVPFRAMEAAKPCELGMFEAGDGAEYARLLGMTQLRLKADDIVERAQRIILA